MKRRLFGWSEETSTKYEFWISNPKSKVPKMYNGRRRLYIFGIKVKEVGFMAPIHKETW